MSAVTSPPHIVRHANPQRVVISTAPGQPQDLAFVDDENGWIVEARPCANGLNGCGSLIEGTADGGRTWTTQYNGPGELDQISFTSPHVGWAWGGACHYDPFFDEPQPRPDCRDTLVETTDGRTWHAVVAPPGADKFDFTGALHGWAATFACEYLSTGEQLAVEPRTCPSTVYSTDDAGRTWTPDLHLQVPVVAIGTSGSAPVIVEQQIPLSIDGSDRLSTLLRTPNGTTWTELSSFPVDFTTVNLLVTLQLAPSGSGWINVFTNGAGCAVGGCQDDINVTTNGGRSWTPLNLNGLEDVFISSQKPCFGGPDRLTPGGSVTSTLAVAIEGNGGCNDPIGLVTVSYNGGRTWTHTTSLGSYIPWTVSFPSATNGWILSSPAGAWRLFTTDDAGAHWTVAATVPVG